MIEFKDLFSGTTRVGLDNIDFKRIDFEGEAKAVICQDNIETYEEKSDKLIITATRSILFDPPMLFKLQVSYYIEHLLKDAFVDKVSWNDYNIKQEIEKDKEFFAGDEWDRLSLLIAQITSSFNNSPLITPPMRMDESL